MAPEVYTITQTNRALSNEQAGRTKRYLISMAIRTACVLAAIVVPGWPKWFFIVGAVVLPYLAVVIANAGRENDEPGLMGVMAVSLPSVSSAQENQRRISRSIDQ
ncbi:MAG: DUF3099 domain-containing protein [Actinomycetia bacterium]|nr:DUF3099 domain-containing protein [Actinomycetes bacterium]